MKINKYKVEFSDDDGNNHTENVLAVNKKRAIEQATIQAKTQKVNFMAGASSVYYCNAEKTN